MVVMARNAAPENTICSIYSVSKTKQVTGIKLKIRNNAIKKNNNIGSKPTNHIYIMHNRKVFFFPLY